MDIFYGVFLANAFCNEAMYFGVCSVTLENPGGDWRDLRARWRSLDNGLCRDQVTEPGPTIALPAGISPGQIGKQAEGEQSP